MANKKTTFVKVVFLWYAYLALLLHYPSYTDQFLSTVIRSDKIHTIGLLAYIDGRERIMKNLVEHTLIFFYFYLILKSAYNKTR